MDEPIFDKELTLIEEVIDFFNSTPVIYDWNNQFYTLNKCVIAYLDRNGDIRRTNKEVDIVVLDSCWNHHVRLTNG